MILHSIVIPKDIIKSAIPVSSKINIAVLRHTTPWHRKRHIQCSSEGISQSQTSTQSHNTQLNSLPVTPSPTTHNSIVCQSPTKMVCMLLITTKALTISLTITLTLPLTLAQDTVTLDLKHSCVDKISYVTVLLPNCC